MLSTLWLCHWVIDSFVGKVLLFSTYNVRSKKLCLCSANIVTKMLSQLRKGWIKLGWLCLLSCCSSASRCAGFHLSWIISKSILAPSAVHNLTKQNVFIAILLSGYGVWNLFFLFQGKIPPSIFKSITGLPCPTTGGVRSVLAYKNGLFLEGFLYNPFSLIYIFLLLYSIIWIIYCLYRKKRVLLPNWLCNTWLITLGLGWVIKFIIGPQYWW